MKTQPSLTKNPSLSGNLSDKMSQSTTAMFKQSQMHHVETSSFLLISIVISLFNSGNVAYEGEDIQIDVRINN